MRSCRPRSSSDFWTSSPSGGDRRGRFLRDRNADDACLQRRLRLDRSIHSRSNTCVLTEDLDGLAEPGHHDLGWLAQRGHVPLGYKGDAKKTAATFPVVGGERFVLPGDRAQRLDDGSIHLLGRDSVTINSGGEKIFVEEVEMAISSHPAVADVLVAGRPSDTWGEAVVAIVQLLPDHAATADELIEHAAKSVARYKLPKSVIFTEAIQRSPVGKADYRWARAQAASLGTG